MPPADLMASSTSLANSFSFSGSRLTMNPTFTCPIRSWKVRSSRGIAGTSSGPMSISSGAFSSMSVTSCSKIWCCIDGLVLKACSEEDERHEQDRRSEYEQDRARLAYPQSLHDGPKVQRRCPNNEKHQTHDCHGF